MPPGAAQRSSTSFAAGGNQTCRERRGQILHPPPPSSKPGKSVTDADFDSHMVGASEAPPCSAANARASASSAKLRSSGGRFAIWRRAAWTASLAPRGCQRCSTYPGGGENRNRDPTPEQGAEYAVQKSSRSSIDQRQSGCDEQHGRACAEPDLLREREPQRHARLRNRREGAGGSRCRSGRRGREAAAESRPRWRSRGPVGRRQIARGSGRGAVQRLPLRRTASSIRRAALRAPGPSTLGIGGPHHHLGAMKRPKHLTLRSTSVRLRRCRNLNLSSPNPLPVRKRGSTQLAMATGKRRKSRSIFSLPRRRAAWTEQCVQQLVDSGPRPPTIHSLLRRSACRFALTGDPMRAPAR